MANSPYMQEALRLARLGSGEASPNPMVGAVVVHQGEIVGKGYHRYQQVKHAETLALEAAGEKAHGASVYVTLEPCSHTGRTPPCADALIAAGVSRVVAAMEDPNPQVAGEGFRRLSAAGITVEIENTATAEARKINESYIWFMQHQRPLVTLKCALTLDGKIAAPEDNVGWITSERARAHVQQVRHAHDAILTGIGTVLADDCLLTDRSGLPRSRPLLRIVLDSQLRIPLDSRMVTSATGDLLIATTSAAAPDRKRQLEARGVRVIAFDGRGGRTDLPSLVAWLGRERYLSLMTEAGSMANWGLLESGVVNRVFLYYAPKFLGGFDSLPMAGGPGRRSRRDAIRLHDVEIHLIPPNEFAVEGYL